MSGSRWPICGGTNDRYFSSTLALAAAKVLHAGIPRVTVADHAECRSPDMYLLEILERRLFVPVRGGERRSRLVFYEKPGKLCFSEIMLYVLNMFCNAKRK